MSALRRRVSALTGVAEDRLERLSGGDLSEVLLVRRPDGRTSVAKGGAAVGAEAAMLRSLAGGGVPAPAVEAEHEGLLLLEYVANDRVFTVRAWAELGTVLRRLHARTGEHYGWPVDYRIGTVELDNRASEDWPAFFGRQRLLSTAAVLDRPWRERIERLAVRLPELLPARPRAAHLHGDLWTGNVLVRDGGLAALIDPACYHGDAEVDLAMLTLFDAPPADFWHAYGLLEPGWEERRPLYQLFPALLHLRLFGAGYAGLVDRLLGAIGA
ncbi:MAG: fructosamine kinase family protein [Alphaproteobacteria bacterium]|nr:fructosamine kinase family protein [Alphaproteobacteria bacterium]